MHQPVTAPEDLADHPPGPQLCTLLAGIDPAQVANHDTVDLLRAWRRLRSFADAGELAVMAEVGRCDLDAAPDSVARLDRPAPNGYVEIAAALTLTENAAARELGLAETLVWRLPTVHAALRAGKIDRAKAWVFADHLGDEELTDAQITRVLAALLPQAPGLTTGQLRARLQRMIIAIDPEAARRRYQAALRERRVVCYLDRDGTATLSATGLDPAAAQAACERIDSLARAVREAGHPATLSHLRADLYTALLDGSVHALSNDQIIAVMLARAAHHDCAGQGGDHDDAAAPAPTGAGGHDDGADHGSDAGDREHAANDKGTGTGAYTGTGTGTGTGSDDAGTADAGTSDAGTGDRDSDSGAGGTGAGGTGTDNTGLDTDTGGSSTRTGGTGTSGTSTDDTGADDTGTDTGIGGRGLVPAPSERARAGLEIRIRLSTLLGRDEQPAELAGLGPILAEPARDAVARHRHARWRFAVTDPAGDLVLAGGTRRRPAPHVAANRAPVPQSAGGVVELQVPAALLAELAADPPAGWEAVIADLAAQYGRRDQLRAALDQQPCTRFPHPALRRHVEIRDRTCRFPGCRRPARKSQQDHTVEHQHGGRSVEDNLGPLCVLHHALKSAGHWRLHQPAPGTFCWSSPLGHGYTTRGEPICPPLPDPLPASPAEPSPDGGSDHVPPMSPAEREADTMPTFPEPDLSTTPTVDDAPDRAPPPEDDPDEPPF